MDIQENLPLTESTFFILLSLAPGPRHGYAIMKDVKALSEDRVSLSTGTLYGAIKRLLDQGWIERVEEPSTNGSGHDRKAYQLTQRGRRILEAETARLGKLYHIAQLRAVQEES